MDFNVEGIAIGYSIDLLNILAKSLDLQVEYVTKPWTQLLKDFKNGKLDLMHTIYKNSKREEVFKFSFPYLVGENAFVVRKTNKDTITFSDLKNKKIGVSKGWLEENLANKYKDIKKLYFKNLEEKLNALSLGKIDAIISDKNIARYYIKKYGFRNIKVANDIIEENDEHLDKYYFATLKKNSILISILNKAYLNTNIEDIENLQKKWFGSGIIGKSIFNFQEQKYLDQKELIKMCLFPNFIPLSGIENNQPQGIVSDIINELKYKTNLDFQLVKTKNLKETFEALQTKHCEFIPTVEYSEKNKKIYNLTKPYLSIPYVAIGKKDKEFFSDISELKGKKVSIVSYTSLVKQLKKKYPSIQIISVNSIDEGLELVKQNKVYVHLTLYPIAKFYIAKASNSDLKIIGRLLKPLQLSVASIKDDFLLSSVLQKSINTLSQVKIDSILNNWTEVKIKKVINYDFVYKVLMAIAAIILLGVWRYSVLKNKNKEINRINKELYASKKEILKKKEEFEAVFMYSKDGIAILDKDLNFIDINSAYLNMLGYEKKELLAKSFLILIPKENQEEMQKLFKKIFKKGFIDHFEKLCIGKDDKKLSTKMTVTLMPDKTQLLLTSKDITSIKLLESQSKLAAMGEMLGNIAHQWRQPLSIITTSATGLSLKADMKMEITESEIKEFSNQVVQQADYLSKTIDDFRNFIKVDIHYLPMSIKDSILSAITLTKAAIKSNYIEIIEQFDEDLTIKGNKNELSQAFINIINNAKDKLKEIEETKQRRLIFISTKKIENKAIEIKIFDNGGGIEEAVINRIFEPYFTTKHQSIGTGLGLSMSDKIIRERHQGSIQAYNEEFEYEKEKYKGACFSIKLFES
jgi:PAS domain S-box-containing protein